MGHWAYGNHVYFFFPRQITESTYKVSIDTLDIRIAVRPADIMPTGRGAVWLADISLNPAR